MLEDSKGFLYPKIDESACIDCGLCEKVCPVITQGQPRNPLQVLAVRNKEDNVRVKSSSGGYFRLIAEKIITSGGVVFGATFDDKWEVHHTFVENVDELQAFMGSKYVQSRIEKTFLETEKILKTGRKVLYSGTSCQIAGLKKFLRKEYENLFTIDVICHGVPSPKVWRDYLDTLPAERSAGKNTDLSSLKVKPVITGISFRDKRTGWKKYGFVAYTTAQQSEAENSGLSPNTQIIASGYARDNLYMKAFLYNLSLRPICFTCPAKAGKCQSDFSLADFWAVDRYCPQFNDDKGVTLVHLNSQKAVDLDKSIDADRVILKKGKVYNRSFIHSASHKSDETKFWKAYEKQGLECIDSICSTIQPSVIKSLYAKFRKIIKRIIIHRS